MIDRALIEAAARAEWEHSPTHSSWSSLNVGVKGEYRDRVAAGIAAVLPAYRAQVIRECADFIRRQATVADEAGDHELLTGFDAAAVLLSRMTEYR